MSEKDNSLLTNKSLAEYNLSREPKLQQSKQMLSEVYERGVAVQKEYEQLKQKCGKCINGHINISLIHCFHKILYPRRAVTLQNQVFKLISICLGIKFPFFGHAFVISYDIFNNCK